MATVVLPYGKKQVAFGLNWLELTNASLANAETRQYAQEVNARRVVLMSERNVAVCGLAVQPTLRASKGQKPVPRTKALSGALMFARAVRDQPHAMLIEQIPQGPMIVVLVRNGLPVPGWDRIGPQETLLREVRSYLENLPPADPVRLYGPGAEAFADIGMAVDSKSFKDLAQALPSVDLKSLELGGLPTDWKKVVGAVAALSMALGILAWLASDYLDELSTQAKNQSEKAAESQQQINQQKALAQQMEDRLNEALRVPAREFVLRRLAALRVIPDRRAGWKLLSVSCEHDCQALWSRESGTYQSFLAGLPGNSADLDGAGGIRSRIVISEQSAAGEGKVPVTSLPTQKDNLVDAGSVFQRFTNVGATEARLMPPVATAMPAVTPSSPSSPAPTAAMPPAYLIGEWTLAGPLHLIQPLAEALPANFSATSLAVQPSDTASSFTLKGKFYVRP